MPTVVDLFCGVGGLTHGLRLAGLTNARFISQDVSVLRPEEVAALYPDNEARVLVGCTLIRLGYNVSHEVVYSEEYGVPQNRRRLVLLTLRLGELALIEPLYYSPPFSALRSSAVPTAIWAGLRGGLLDCQNSLCTFIPSRHIMW